MILLPFYAFQGPVFVILPKEIWGVHLVSWFLGVVTFGVALPLYKVLEHSGASMITVVPNLLHLVLFFIIDQARWGSGVVQSVGILLDIWGKKGGMEDWMNHP